MSGAIIAIDDEPHNLALLESYLEDTAYEVTYFPSASEALTHLRTGAAADAILLDRMMPEMDGMAFIEAFRVLDAHAATPIIMQTAAAGAAEITEGIAAGVYYYLTKPYARDVLVAIVTRALADREFHRGLERTMAQMSVAMAHLESIQMSFRTFDDVRAISFFLASLCPNPQTAILGMTELMVNAVEHGNLGLSYADKSELIRSGGWQSEVERRLNLPENRRKQAQVWFQRDDSGLVLTIEDVGTGFDWTPYIEFDRSRARESHGRGIAMSRLVSFDEITYVAPGNKVVCRKRA